MLPASPTALAAAPERDRRIAEIFAREGTRLRNFIRKRVADPGDAEDILQDAFFALVQADRLMNPIEHAGAWLFQVARNRITDLFRKKKSTPWPAASGFGDADLELDDVLPSPDGNPELAYETALLLEELEAALRELPAEQRDVFIAHELEGRSFKDLAEESGAAISTLLSRKHYAVRHLRERLRAFYEDRL